MPSLSRYCQGVIRHTTECQPSADTAKGVIRYRIACQALAELPRRRRLWGWGTRSQRGCRRHSGRQLSAQGSWSCSSRRSLERTRHLAAAQRSIGNDHGAPAQSKLTQGDCASLQRLGRRLVLQIHEEQGTSGSKDHFPAIEAHSTVQHSWLQPCPRQDHLSLGSKLRTRGKNS